MFGRIETVRMRPATTGTTSGQQHRAGSEAAMEAGTEGLSSTAPDVREIAGRAINARPSDYGSPISLSLVAPASSGAERRLFQQSLLTDASPSAFCES